MGVGHVGVVGPLLKRGADPDVGDQEGKKPLHIVAQLGRAELAELLIRYGAGPKAGDSNRWPPQKTARRHD